MLWSFPMLPFLFSAEHASHKSHFSSFCLFSCVTDGKVVHGRVLGRDGGDEAFRRLIKDLFPSIPILMRTWILLLILGVVPLRPI